MTDNKWIKVKDVEPDKGFFVHTKIDDSFGARNFAILRKDGNLWFDKSGTYVYYSPTHWMKINPVN